MEDEDMDHWQEALAYCHDFYFSLIEKYAKPGKLLDIGCGNGHLLETGINRGWSVHGYDVDQSSTQAVSERLNVAVDHGDFFFSRLS